MVNGVEGKSLEKRWWVPKNIGNIIGSIVAGGFLVFVASVIFWAGEYTARLRNLEKTDMEIVSSLKEIKENINALTSKIEVWQHQAEVFKKLETEVWRRFTKE